MPPRRKTDPRHLLTAWLGVIVLAVNLFGWPLTSSLPETASSPPADSMAAMFDGAPICEHAAGHNGGDGSHQDKDGHGKMVCPACFPLGNASSGALVSGPSAAPAPLERTVVERTLPADTLTRSSFDSHRYRARAPPQAV